jgi:hypothetical protein
MPMMQPAPIRPPRNNRPNNRPKPYGGAPSVARSLVAVLLCCLAATPIFAQSQPTEDDVKAAYLFNFSHFIRYSAADAPAKTFDICLLGRDEISRILPQVVQNETVDNRPVRVIQFDRAAQARACAIVYMGPSEAGRVDQDLAALEGSSALTVSDLPHFTDRGGMIQFILQNNRVRFAVNLAPAQHARLALSSELLKVALSVNPPPAQPPTSTPPTEAP